MTAHTTGSLKNAYAVIMAGGRGERFWPQSRLSHPKQLLRLLGNLTLIEQTVERLLPLFDPEHIVIITNDDYVAPMRSLMSNIPSDNIIGEPVGKDTAPCIALASAYIHSIASDPDPVICLLPSDQMIQDVHKFDDVLSDCIDYAAESNQLTVIGVKPATPSTGFGYIRLGDPLNPPCSTAFFKAEAFKEKPDLKTAAEYLKEGCYRWNAGIFILRQSLLLSSFQQQVPELYDFYRKMTDLFASGSWENAVSLYVDAPKISFDYAVMEKIGSSCVVAESNFDWDDVGTWTSMRNQIRPESNNNVVRGLHLGIDTRDCIVVGNSKHLIATVDVQDMVIVHTDDATLVCNGKSAQRVKDLVQLIASKPELESFL